MFELTLLGIGMYCGILWYIRRANRLAMESYREYYRWLHPHRGRQGRPSNGNPN